MAWNLASGFLYVKASKRNPYLKMKVLKKTDYIGYLRTKPSKYVKISLLTS